jgi:hypothetical protein
MSDEPTGVEVEIDGQKFLVTEEFKTALESQQQTIRTNLEEEMRQETMQKNSRTVPEEKEIQDVTDISDPNQMMAEIKKSLKEELKAEADKEKKENKFWEDFYKQNKDLQNRDRLVRTTAQEVYDELQTAHKEGGDKKVYEVLSKAVRDQITISPAAETAQPGVVLEGGPQKSIELGTESKPEEKVPTMGDLIKKRRAAKIHKITQAVK